jgi:hypothetical protein
MFTEPEPIPIRENTARQEFVREHLERIHKALVGKTVNRVRYASRDECEYFIHNRIKTDEWRHHHLVVEFTDGTQMFAAMDDNLNSAGSLLVAPAGTGELLYGSAMHISADELDLYEGCE